MSSSVLSTLFGLFRSLDEILFPRVCVSCGKKLTAGEPSICAGCLIRLPYTCYQGKPDNATERLFYGVVPVERASSLIFYYPDTDSRIALMALKYGHHPEIGRFLGAMMAAELNNVGFFQGVDALVPVPLAPKRERLRGYNQSAMLAKGVAKVTGLPVWDNVVVRTVENQTQTHLNHYERQRNVEGIFTCVRPQQIRGKHLLLIDDVVTTGSTLASCIKSMNVFSGTRFSVLTLALTANVFSAPRNFIHPFDV